MDLMMANDESAENLIVALRKVLGGGSTSIISLP
jgi:hypothetical protein